MRVTPPACSDNCECNNGIDDDGDGLIDWQQDLGCSSRDDGSEGGLASGTIEGGWTVFERAPDTRIVFVSDSLGDDQFDGLSPAPTGSGMHGPKRTLNAAWEQVRGGSADWMLLRRGDSWDAGLAISKSGRSATERIVIASYGEALERPTLRGSISGTGANLVFAHIHVASTGGISFLSPRNLLIEGCRIPRTQYHAIAVHGAGGSAVQVRRNVAADSESSGFYINGVHDILIEDNVIVHPAMASANHGMYITRVGNDQVVTRGNLVWLEKAVGNGIMQRPGGIVEGNVVVGVGAEAITIGACNDEGTTTNCAAPVPVLIHGNLVADRFTGNRGGISVANAYIQDGASVRNNIAVRSRINSEGGHGTWEGNILLDGTFTLSTSRGVTWRNNTVFGTRDETLVSAQVLPTAPPFVAENNRFYSTARAPNQWFEVPQLVGFAGWQQATGETGSGNAFTVRNPACSIGDYAASLGRQASTAAFFEGALEQAKFQYLHEYTAEALITYFRDALALQQ